VSFITHFFPESRLIAVGTFDDPNWITPEVHVWTRSAADCMAFPPDVPVFETVRRIDVASFAAEKLPPHLHGENCPECGFADLSLLPVCCTQPDLHVLRPVNDRVLFLQCLNPRCNQQAMVPKKS
jgi:hypothetical protein